MEQIIGHNGMLAKYKENPPKIIGDYKKQGWAVKALEKIENDPVEYEENGTLIVKAVLKSNTSTYYPSFLNLDPEKKGQIIGVYFISEEKDQFNLIPFEIAKEFMGKNDQELLPFKYRTVEKIENDEFQTNWPEFT